MCRNIQCDDFFFCVYRVYGVGKTQRLYPVALAAATTEPLQVCSPGMRHCPRARATLDPPVIVPVFKQDVTLCRRVCGEFLLSGGRGGSISSHSHQSFS